MADEFANWWDTPATTATPTTSFDIQAAPPPPPSISPTLNAIASFGWPANSSVDSSPVMLRHGNSDAAANQIMGFTQDWNQAFFVRGDKPETSGFRPSNSDGRQEHWGESSDFRQMNLGFSGGGFGSQLSTSNPESSRNLASYGGLLIPEEPRGQNPNLNQNLSMMMMNNFGTPESWSNYSPLLTKPQTTHLHFTNSTPFWNASSSVSPSPSSSSIPKPDNRNPTFFPKPEIKPQIPPPPSYAQKLKSTSSTTKKSSPESTSSKRTRIDSSPPLKVRKEKVGDRISALQQLVSPFGKTDTASVLSDAIEYIKYLHDQIRVLTTPYMRNQNGAPTNHQQSIIATDRTKEEQGCHPDLRTRGLCLVSISSTFPLGHDSSVDFWTPTFGATFR